MPTVLAASHAVLPLPARCFVGETADAPELRDPADAPARRDNTSDHVEHKGRPPAARPKAQFLPVQFWVPPWIKAITAGLVAREAFSGLGARLVGKARRGPPALEWRALLAIVGA